MFVDHIDGDVVQALRDAMRMGLMEWVVIPIGALPSEPIEFGTEVVDAVDHDGESGSVRSDLLDLRSAG